MFRNILAGEEMRRILQHIHPVVFPLSSLTILAFVLVGSLFPDILLTYGLELQANIVEKAGWFYVLSMSAFVLLAIYIAMSRYGKLRLGPDNEAPEFSNFAWISMMFSAGMGIGLLFFGVAEPLIHFSRPAPPILTPGSVEAAQHAMGLTLFHWGLHPWACYSLVGLCLAYFGFRRNQPFSFRCVFRPLLGKYCDGLPGDLIDFVAILSTMFGVATSLGLGAIQINTGLNELFGVGISTEIQMAIIAGVTLIATISVVSGIQVGIRLISQTNMTLATLILALVIIFGSSWFILDAVVANIGIYLQTLPKNSFWTAAFSQSHKEWLGNWTVFYWAWWISWSPFVGMFIARVSKGRTIREFIFATLLLPTMFTILWMTAFGGSAIDMEMHHGIELSSIVNENVSVGLFAFLGELGPLWIFGSLGLICLILFFVSSSDSASLVIDTIASGGKTDPHYGVRVFWALSEGAVAAVLLLSGGLEALQTASINSALPFTVLIFVMVYCLLKAAKQDYKKTHLTKH